MTEENLKCLATGENGSEAGVIRVKLEEVDVEVDTVYCGEKNWERVDTVGSFEEDHLAEDEANWNAAKEGSEEEAFESVPELERDVKVVGAGDTLAHPPEDGPPTKKIKTKVKLKKVKPGICVKCNIGFPSTDLLEHHLSTAHQDERPYSCRHCEKAFQTLSNCRKHESIHDSKRWQGEPQFQCDLCPRRYHLKPSLDLHRKKTHFGYKPPTKPVSAPVTQHHSTSGTRNPNAYQKPKQERPCPHCDLKFGRRYELKRHMSCHSKERPFPCPICQHRFKQQKVLKKHIRNVHENATPTGISHPSPKWQAGQPHPCSVCGKVFPIASQLRDHMTLHNGEMLYACDICGKRFRRRDGLNRHVKNKHRTNRQNNPLKLCKCLICGKDNFKMYSGLRDHRMKRHAHIPYNSEKEKPFACGVCGKPYFLREDAIICARLKHDPSSLLRAMFRHKCPECPEEMLGFRNLSVLRKHWAEAHQEKTLPAKLRIGMYDPNLKADELPRCSVDKKKVQNWKVHGIPPEVIKSETPLFIELPLLPIQEEERFKKKTGRGRSQASGLPRIWECDLCGIQMSRSSNLKRHKQVVHNKLNGERKGFQCSLCHKLFGSARALEAHKKTHFQPKGKVGQPQKIPDAEPVPPVTLKTEVEDEGCAQNEAELKPSTFRCQFCARTFASVKAVRTHELRKHVKPWSNKKKKSEEGDNAFGSFTVCKTVNVHDATGIATVLNYLSVRVSLLNWKFPRGMLDKCKRASR